jgi:hypothetical protein
LAGEIDDVDRLAHLVLGVEGGEGHRQLPFGE